MFRASEPLLLFDYFRAPYEQVAPAASTIDERPSRDACARVVASKSDRTLFWVPSRAPAEGRIFGSFKIGPGSIGPIFGGLLPDQHAMPWLEAVGGDWHRSTAICDADETWVASVWIDAGGNVFLPFDPNEAIEVFWSERYADYVGSRLKRDLRTAARRTYYRVRPFIPRPMQILVRRWFSRVQRRTSFPRWPIETALHDLYDFLFELLGALSGEPVPMISAWPRGYEWALVLTHDVETVAGYENIDLLCDIEISGSYRSSWNFVPRNHHVLHDDVLEKLRANGFEVGVHGLYHDGRDIAEIDARLPLIREYAERWNAAGFRSPATLRDWASMPRLGFDYDSTYFDTSPYEPQPGGCCSWLPYMIDDLVELPITLPQDHTLFEILGGLDERLWQEKARFLRDRGGMALALTHPDYARNERLVRAYTNLLSEFADDATAWKVLPSEISAWWRMRSESRLARDNGGWHIVGPASELGAVQFAGADG